jgi:hypothetical protein
MKSSDRINYICDECKKEFGTTWRRYQKKQTNCCGSCAAIRTLRGRPKKSPRENHARWGDGTYITPDGYKLVITDKKTTSGRTKYKREHILVMEEFLGREIDSKKGGKTGEIVHHIDGDKLNNKIENLILCESPQEHRYLHGNLESVAFELVKLGIILFDKDSKKYYTAENELGNS